MKKMKNENNSRIQALFHINIRGISRPILPTRSVLYFFAGLITVFTAFFIAEYYLTTGSSTRGALTGVLSAPREIWTPQWETQNKLINNVNYKRIQNHEKDPLWRTTGMPFDENQTKHGKRILVVGDSYVWGDGHVNLNDLWWRQLQHELERRGYFDVEVLALGRNGASTQDQFYWLKNLGLLKQLNPDFIIFGYVINDPDMKDETGSRLVRQAVEHKTSQKLVEFSAAKNTFPTIHSLILRRLQRKADIKTCDAKAGFPYDIWVYKILEGENFRKYKKMLMSFAQFLNDSATPYFFVTTPTTPNKHEFSYKYKIAKQTFADAGIPFFDTLPSYLEQYKGSNHFKFLVNPANGHPGPIANQFYANQVADILIRSFPNALGRHDTEQKTWSPEINDWFPETVSPKQQGSNRWFFHYPTASSELLHLPIKIPHIALNFKRPEKINNIKISSPFKAKISIWVTTIKKPEGYNTTSYKNVGSYTGKEISLKLTDDLLDKKITSLRIALTGDKENQPNYRVVKLLNPKEITLYHSKAFSYSIPDLKNKSDNIKNNFRSPFLLLEDSQILPKAHSLHASIRQVGLGTYSHWMSSFLFSSSDNTDPRFNGREYKIVEQTSNLVLLEIDFKGR